MSGYTFASGQRRVTVSSVCPGCRRRRVLARAEVCRYTTHWLPAAVLFCGPAHQGQFVTQACRALERLGLADSTAEVVEFFQDGLLPVQLAEALQGLS